MSRGRNAGLDVPTARVHVASADTRWATELCIRSALRLAGGPLELLVGDGGSTDGTLDVLREFQRRGAILLEEDPRGRSHAQWLDRWVAGCDRRYAVFVDSDVQFLRRGWLAELVATAEGTGSIFVCAELLPGSPHYVHPLTGDEARLAERPSPWLMVVEVEPVRRLGTSFAYAFEEDPAAPGGIVSYDVGAALLVRLRRESLPWTAMPPGYRSAYRHYGGLSWKPTRGRVGRRQRLKLARLRCALEKERLLGAFAARAAPA